ncbi:MAG: thioredoxin domain-containing protein, partial [Xanthomonadales bacterium]|nr:thioredoxin domain-containing protein [Xanthomonadales bacterium]
MIKTRWILFLTMAAGSLLADPPGVTYTPDLRQQLDAALQSRGGDYQPRTRHLQPDGRPTYTNRLISEDSPYLLQHAHNPVDWYSWGVEAFARAKRENKPIFLSIGYSTCHWCHVMEHESFEDEDVAAYLNSHFIAIKVDREQRPDIDEIYMTAVQVLNRRGGWPMSSFLTPDGKTFFGGTYYPRESFMNLLHQVVKAWNEDQPGLLAQADEIADRVQRYLDQAQASGELANAAPGLAVTRLRERHDERNGGFSPAPKFPNEPDYLFLIDYARRHADADLAGLINFDLGKMAQGGIYDQVGGGFHRYSTDDDWLVPHFEKMLYNQAQLARVYLQASNLTGNREFRRVTRQTLDYVLRDMKAPGGGFYSATDADSEGHEGRFFLWSREQVRAKLSEPDANLAIELFNISESGNYEGSNIPHLSAPLSDGTPREQEMEKFLASVDRIRFQLYSAREERIHPGR